ncbi:MAG: DoxX family protein [Chthoniobacterales bacterium]
MGSGHSRFILAAFFVAAGILHFVAPAAYLAIMPPYLPWHTRLVAISGVAEIAGGIALCVPQTRRLAAWSLIVLLILVFPANLRAISSGMRIAGNSVPAELLWARLPLQLLLIAWVYVVCLRSRSHAQADGPCD